MLMLAFVFSGRRPQADLDAGDLRCAKAGSGEPRGFNSAFGFWASACAGNTFVLGGDHDDDERALFRTRRRRHGDRGHRLVDRGVALRLPDSAGRQGSGSHQPDRHGRQSRSDLVHRDRGALCSRPNVRGTNSRGGDDMFSSASSRPGYDVDDRGLCYGSRVQRLFAVARNGRTSDAPPSSGSSACSASSCWSRCCRTVRCRSTSSRRCTSRRWGRCWNRLWGTGGRSYPGRRRGVGARCVSGLDADVCAEIFTSPRSRKTCRDSWLGPTRTVRR